jgi:hypothetical protein
MTTMTTTTQSTRNDDDSKNKDEATQLSTYDCYTKYYCSWTLYVLSFALSSLAAGLIYGWPALRAQLVYEREGQDGNSTAKLSKKERGMMIFTIGSWSTQGGRFFMGIARYKFGTRNFIMCCMIGVTCGSIGIALLDPTNVVSLSISPFLIGTGSSVQLCTQPVASLFPQNFGMVLLASLSGAFQISGLIFLALMSNLNNRRQSFFIFSHCLFVLMMIAFFLYPKSKSFLLHDDCSNTNKKDNDDDNDNANEMQSNHNGSPHNSQPEREDKGRSS